MENLKRYFPEDFTARELADATESLEAGVKAYVQGRISVKHLIERCKAIELSDKGINEMLMELSK